MNLRNLRIIKFITFLTLAFTLNNTFSKIVTDEWTYFHHSIDKSLMSNKSSEILTGYIQSTYIDLENGAHEKFLFITDDGRQIDLIDSGISTKNIEKFIPDHEVEISFYSKSKNIINGGIEVEVGAISQIRQKKIEKISKVQKNTIESDVRTFRVAFINLSIAGRGGAGSVNSSFISKFKKSIEESTFGRIKIVSTGRDIYSLNWDDGNCKQGPSIGSRAAREAIPDVYSRYDRVITHYPMELGRECTWSGIANVLSVDAPFSSSIVSVAGKHVQVSVHEFGHSVGLGHSGFGYVNDEGKFITTSTYGDKQCYMGNNNDASFFNPLHLDAMKVIKSHNGIAYGETGKSYIISELDDKSLENDEKVALRYGNFIISFDRAPYALTVRRKVGRNAAKVRTLQPGKDFVFYESFNRKVGIKYNSVTNERAQVSVGYFDEMDGSPFPLDDTMDSAYLDPSEQECVLKVVGDKVITEDLVGINQKYSKMTLKANIEGNKFCTRENARLKINTLDNSEYGLSIDKQIDFRNIDFTSPYPIEIDFPFLRKSIEKDLFTYMLSFEGHSYYSKDYRKGHRFKNLTCDNCPKNSCELAPQLNLRAERTGNLQLVIASNTSRQCPVQDYQVNIDLNKDGLSSYPTFLPALNSSGSQLSFNIKLRPGASIFVPLKAKQQGINKVTARNMSGQGSNSLEHTSTLTHRLIRSSILFGTMNNSDPYSSREINRNDVSSGSIPEPDDLIINELKKIYQDVLNRQPKEEGLNYWLAQFKNGQTLEQIRGHIENSHESKIRKLYINHLDREPREPGLKYWVGRLDDGANYEDIKRHFRTIKECKKDCLDNSSNIKNELTKIYQEVLGRSPREEGLNYWLSQYNNGLTLEQIRGHIENSNESKVRKLYLNHLGRTPDESGLKYWVGRLDEGASYEGIKKHFRTIKECKNDCL